MSEHIVISSDRYITIPESLYKIGVQFDHNAETVTFDCPRYWDDHDLSMMKVYVNYMRPDESVGTHLCDNVVVDSSDDTVMHFDWTISGHVTEIAGPLSFLVCIREVNIRGDVLTHWNTELNSDMYISSGMKCREAVLRRYPDIITQLLLRMDTCETGTSSSAASAAASAANAKASEDKVAAVVAGVESFVEEASTSATNAKTSETNAANSASTAASKATEASASASAAKTSETNAANSASIAKTSETNAAGSASTAASKATEASTSASNAKTSETNAAGSASTASTKASEASSSASAAKTSETNAAGSASAAKTSETNAAGSASAAKTSETNAANSASAAKTSETNAANSASAASTSETNAEGSAILAQSWAAGGTNTRADEEVNNAKYWCSQAQAIVGGDFATSEEAQGYANVAESNAKAYFETADIDCGEW